MDNVREASEGVGDGPLSTAALVEHTITWGPLIGLSLLIFWFSSQPSFGQSHLVFSALDSLFGRYEWYSALNGIVSMLDAYASNIAHFLEYALLTLTAIWAVSRQWPDNSHRYLVAISYAALFALSDEFHQYFVPGRHCDWRDVTTDWLGAALTIAVVIWIHRIRNSGRTTSTG